MKLPPNGDELFARLCEQLLFLQNSALSYDQGFKGEAMRLAVVLRVLLHDTANSHSLLESIGVKQSLKFHDVVGPLAPNAIALCGLKIGQTRNGIPHARSGVGTVENSPALPIVRQIAHEVVQTILEQVPELSLTEQDILEIESSGRSLNALLLYTQESIFS